jgi:hypothetical protein
MERIHLAWSRVQYGADVNCELVKNLTVEVMGNFLIRWLLKTDSHIITQVMYRS